MDEYAPVRARRARLFLIVAGVVATVMYVPIIVWLISEGIAGTLTLGSFWVLTVPAPVLLGTIGFIGLAQRNSTLRDNPMTWTQNL
ncbi:hypothetical protein PX701_09375 [Agromyces sp. H3Y2-19a]|uniref:hypothetical protein n=1 Tax=Agromyces TaxID=33877 RepID=UPI001E64B47D|nr:MULTISPECIES: hypothetical protein [Agromyces]MCD5344990.1 hypothetical protein [Agromyces sp. S2-1-8]MDF0513829.1 hypothetical protein [Agromyces chromiiresistens]